MADGARAARVLIVDDDESLLTAFKRYLSRGHEVHVVTSGPEALELLDKGERFDVILCDITMPDMTGADLYEILLQRYPENAGKVVFMTGGDYQSPVQEFFDEVPVRCLDKPVSLERLREVVVLAVSSGLPRRAREVNG